MQDPGALDAVQICTLLKSSNPQEVALPLQLWKAWQRKQQEQQWNCVAQLTGVHAPAKSVHLLNSSQR